MKKPVRVAVTGPAGNIGYALLFRIAAGDMLGPDQPVILQLLERNTPESAARLKGVMMELADCAFPLLADMTSTADPMVAFKDADAIGLGALANASFWQHFPLKKRYPQRWVTHEELKERGYLNEDGTVRLDGREFVIFYVGDYDASAWTAQTTPYLWDHPDRGKVPMMWAISPVLAERVPMVMHNYRMTASENDYFVAADNGAGYLLPGMLQQPRAVSGLPSGLEAWSRHCRTYYRRWGLSVTGFVIDGEAPGLSEEGLECYRRFSPNGIVPQKVPLTLLYKDMPVLRSDYDITSPHPDEAARVMMDRISRRPVPFHWFRAILKSPSWYKEVRDELHRQNPKIEWLDAPTFFELYRLYLQQNETAAKGEIQMK